MKGLLMLLGESFRLGGQGTRSRGDDRSYPEQINACKTHIKLIEKMKGQGCDMDVILSSYTTKFDKNLLDIYNNYIVDYKFYNDCIGMHNLFHTTLERVNTEKYDFILYIRVDLYLKDMFIDIFNPSWKTIHVPSICFVPYHRENGHPRINNMMLFIPKKYFNYLKDIYLLPLGDDGHLLWGHLMNKTDLTYDDLDAMINTFHDSDSAKDYNPMYYIVNRPQQTIFHSQGYIFNKGTFWKDP
jgi:hypothetical protein